MKILRDLSMLQIQMRDLPGFLETRQKLLTIKPTNRMHWFTFAISQHLLNRYTQAVGVVDAYEKTLEGAEPENDYEHSEMLLYKVHTAPHVSPDVPLTLPALSISSTRSLVRMTAGDGQLWHCTPLCDCQPQVHLDTLN